MVASKKCYIARSALQSFLLSIVRSLERGIAGLTLDFADDHDHGCNWIIVGVDTGNADPYRAYSIVANIERLCADWVMVEDGDELDGHPVETPDFLH